MAKPSIFSSDYDKSMRRRKRMIRSFIIIVVVVSLIGAIAMISNVNSKDGKGKIFSFLKTEDNTDNGQQSSNSKKISTDNDEVEKNDPIKENTTNDEAVKDQGEEKVIEEAPQKESLEIVLPSGEKAIAFIDVNDGVKTFHKVDLDDILYNINPSKNTVVILDTNTQSLILSDINGKQKDITKKSHTSTKGITYTKENRLKKYPDLVWNALPKFINDDEIAYVSQLPLLSIQPNKYVWKYLISNDTHNIVKGKYYGKKIKIGNLSEEGLEVIIDGIKKVIE